MFKKRKPKTKSDQSIKRKKVQDEDDNQEMDQEEPIVPLTNSSKTKLNQFATSNASKRSKELIEERKIQSDRTIVPKKYAGDATYESQIDTAKDRDARAILERNLQLNKEEQDLESSSKKTYKGKAGYKNYIAKKESQIGANKYTGTQGPIRAQTWARSICRFDYQPDICKDYKETGFCGFGDSCIFLHDRGDYKSGWQLEKEFEEKERKKKLRLERGLNAEDNDDEEDDDKYLIVSDDEEQFACTLCRNPFVNAVETLCGHFFCESCALKQYKKSSRCFNCKKPTNGVFNVAEKLRQREQRQKELEQDSESEVEEEVVEEEEQD